MRTVCEYRPAGREHWSVVLGAPGETYAELEAWVLSHIADAAECRPRNRVTDNGGGRFVGCAQCGGDFWAKRSDARYCSPGCRKRAERVRHRDPAPPTPASGAAPTTLADILDGDAVGDAPQLSAYDVFAPPRRTRRGYRSAATPPAAVKASASTHVMRGGGSSSTTTNHNTGDTR